MQDATQRYFNLKQEVEESPVAVLRNELGTKQLEIIELESKVKSAVEQRDDYREKFDQIKRDMIGLKRQIDQEKERTLENQAKELEQLKTMMKAKQAQEEERGELNALKNQLFTLQGKLGDQATMQAEDEARAGSKRWGKKSGGVMSQDRTVLFDDYARKNQPSPTRRQFAQSYAESVPDGAR